MTSKTPATPRRRPLRWQGFDYGTNHAYFLTFCTHARDPFLGWIDADGVAHRSAAGEVVAETWGSLPQRFRGVRLDALVVMPDHLHGILTLSDSSDGVELSFLPIVNALKSISAIGINRVLGRSRAPVWQRSFHDRVIRDEDEFAHLCWSIEENPVRWAREVKEGQGRPRNGPVIGKVVEG